MTHQEWLQAAHGESRIDCHTKLGQQCAGSAIYRANVCKRPKDPTLLTLPADKVKVFKSPFEFVAHHEGVPIIATPTRPELPYSRLWTDRFWKLFDELDSDRQLTDVDYVEVLDMIESRANTSSEVKRAELKKRGFDV